VVLYRSGPDNDCYIIPFNALEQLLIPEHLITSEKKRSNNKNVSSRWIGSIYEDMLRIRNADHTINVSQYYNAIHLLQ